MLKLTCYNSNWVFTIGWIRGICRLGSCQVCLENIKKINMRCRNGKRPVHFKELTIEEMEELKTPSRASAKAINVPLNRVGSTIDRTLSTTVDTAFRLPGTSVLHRRCR